MSLQKQQFPEPFPYTQFAIKAAVAIVVIILGVAGGILSSDAVTRQRAIDPQVLANQSFLEVGDLFPDYELQLEGDKSTVSVSDLLTRGPAILVFVSDQCNACDVFGNQWQKRVMPRLRKDIQVVLIYDADEAKISTSQPLPSLLPGSVVASTDRATQKSEDGITATPTVVALDQGGRLRFIVTGYDRRVDGEFINDNL